MLDPNIWEDPDFASLGRDARLLFIGLVSNADDQGYLRGHAGSLKRLVFGFDDDLKVSYVSELLSEMATKMPSVHVFYVEDEAFIHLSNWNDYQKQREDRVVASVYPKCVTCHTGGGHVTANSSQSTAEVSKLSKVSKQVNTDTGKSDFKKEGPEDESWNAQAIYYAEKLGFIDALSEDEMERFLKACRLALVIGRKKENLSKAFSYCVDHNEIDPHKRLLLFFKIYENGLQKKYGG